MSKIGRIPIIIKEGLTVSQNGRTVVVAGQKGSLTFEVPIGVFVSIANARVTVSQTNASSKSSRALFGLTRATISNMIQGVSTGFEKKLELSGVGYRAQASGRDLTLSVGFSHPVKVQAPEGITFSISENVITVSGIDKTLVGDVAAKVRNIRKPEPYKGKGISYKGEKIRRKAGKAAKAVGTK